MKFIDNKNPDFGFWIKTEETEEWYGTLKECSICKSWTLDDGKFCPNCGSKMFNGRDVSLL